ncbi:hypothetical protein J7E80_16705 [Arthrobacter sp. ISL-28]|nr:hypothetical protein [Arthrobacter sp. ISL-28]
MNLDRHAAVLFAEGLLPGVPFLLERKRFGSSEVLHRLGMLCPLVLYADVEVGEIDVQALWPEPNRAELMNDPLFRECCLRVERGVACGEVTL